MKSQWMPTFLFSLSLILSLSALEVGAAQIKANQIKTNQAKFDPPDLNFEFRLHKQFRKTQEPKNSFDSVRGPFLTETYRIQKGESLWSLSEMLYGDGQYWPKVWASNKLIADPNLIRPGHELQFLMGSQDDAPAFRISEDGDEGLELVAQATPQVEIPPPVITPRPLINLPKSFPEWQSVYKVQPVQAPLDDRGLNFKFQKAPNRLFLTAFVQEKELEPIGYFLETDLDSGLPVVNQLFYLKMKKGMGQPGQKVQIARETGRVRSQSPYWEDKKKIYAVQIMAEAELQDIVTDVEFDRSRDRRDYEVFRAVMTKTTNLSLKGFSVIPGELEVVDLTASGRTGAASAQIIGAAKLNSSMMYGPGEIVFLDQGTNAGIKEGDLYQIFIDRRIRHLHTPIKFSPTPSGTIKIVRVTPEVSTGVILQTVDGVMQGDKIGPMVETPTQSRREEAPSAKTKDSELDDELEEEFEDEL